MGRNTVLLAVIACSLLAIAVKMWMPGYTTMGAFKLSRRSKIRTHENEHARPPCQGCFYSTYRAERLA